MVVYGYDEEGFYINDSNCVARSREKWTYDRIKRQIKNIWVYSRDMTDGKPGSEKPVSYHSG